ncbi:hypothetical protein [Natronorubrum texcoconense]|uniref:hypothetical protein n=1 Tax=Natronorubrum texcoconense TaxID=1095776 RepID=UPI0011137E7B|nr:hypothetical protein [Natronorubrum texcoconense]
MVSVDVVFGLIERRALPKRWLERCRLLATGALDNVEGIVEAGLDLDVTRTIELSPVLEVVMTLLERQQECFRWRSASRVARAYDTDPPVEWPTVCSGGA